LHNDLDLPLGASIEFVMIHTASDKYLSLDVIVSA
jgi:hypothetical protein